MLFLLLIYALFYYFVMRSNTIIGRAWVEPLSKSKHVKISLAVLVFIQ